MKKRGASFGATMQRLPFKLLDMYNIKKEEVDPGKYCNVPLCLANEIRV